VDTNGIPLALLLSAANVHDSRLFEPLIDALPPIRQCAGRPRRRPAKLHADKGCDYDRCRRAARRRGITPRIARRGVESSERLGRHRWVWWSARWLGSPASAGLPLATSGGSTSCSASTCSPPA
jgi:IS5 family transposase